MSHAVDQVEGAATPHLDVSLIGVDILDVDSAGVALHAASELGVRLR